MSENPQVHILNGDALNERFPEELKGQRIILRECFVDGDVAGDDLNTLFHNRSHFLAQNYGGEAADYYVKFVPEVEKILSIVANSMVYLWFEEDLFCQVNLWFTINLLAQINYPLETYLILPHTESRFSFGDMTNEQLRDRFDKKLELASLKDLAELWKLYRSENTEGLLELGQQLSTSYSFLLPAIQAHIRRLPDKNGRTYIHTILSKIMRELETEDFGTIFREFNRREAIYGFGDLQVRRLYDQIR